MKRSILLAAALASSLFFTNSIIAQTVASEAVGFTTKDCLAGSDTRIAVPFTRLPEFVGSVESVSGNNITVVGDPFTVDQFVYAAGTQPKTYFVLIGAHASSNPLEGRTFTITDNTVDTLTVDTADDDGAVNISGILAQTQIRIIPYHTLSSLYPDTDQNVSFTPSPSIGQRRTEILIPNYAGAGINLATSATYFYNAPDSQWKRFSPFGPADDIPLVIDGYFIVRQSGGAPTVKFTALGGVSYQKWTIPLETRTAGKQDNYVSLMRPVDVQLNDLGLTDNGAFATNSTVGNRIDELFLFNDAAVGINKSTSATYYHSGGAWRKFGGGATATEDHGTDVIPAGSAILIRKGASGAGADVLWKNAPTYSQ